MRCQKCAKLSRIELGLILFMIEIGEKKMSLHSRLKMIFKHVFTTLYRGTCISMHVLNLLLVNFTHQPSSDDSSIKFLNDCLVTKISSIHKQLFFDLLAVMRGEGGGERKRIQPVIVSSRSLMTCKFSLNDLQMRSAEHLATFTP